MAASKSDINHNELYADASRSASAAGLRYLSDTKPGITRKKHGNNFKFYNAKGEVITDDKVLNRVKKLVIPPAWTNVWICPSPNGHIQATGRDLKGRKQYIYHPEWQTNRSQSKFGRMLAFGKMLPEIRKQIEADLK